ncbi:MAG: NTP transferase domain-containing protein [Myxococcota bacterium]
MGAPTAALVLAGRRGPDPLAAAEGVSHRALVRVGGVPMLERVIGALRASPWITEIAVSIEEPESLEPFPQLAQWRDEGAIRVLPCAESPARSAVAGLGQLGVDRALVAAADLALLTAERVDGFLAAADATAADLAVGVVERAVVRNPTAGAARTWVQLRDGAFTGANLFAFRTSRAWRAADFFVRAEAHRKKPWRWLGALGPSLGVRYLAGALDLYTAFESLSRRTQTRIAPVRLREAEAALDVDKHADLALAERILAQEPPVL